MDPRLFGICDNHQGQFRAGDEYNAMQADKRATPQVQTVGAGMVEKSGLKLLDSFTGGMRSRTRAEIMSQINIWMYVCTILGVNSERGEALFEKQDGVR